MNEKNRHHTSWRCSRKQRINMQRVNVISISAVDLKESIDNILLIVKTWVKRVKYVNAYRRWWCFCNINEFFRDESVWWEWAFQAHQRDCQHFSAMLIKQFCRLIHEIICKLSSIVKLHIQVVILDSSSSLCMIRLKFYFTAWLTSFNLFDWLNAMNILVRN